LLVRLIDLSTRAIVLPVLMLLAALPIAAEPASKTQLEQRVIDTARMLEGTPRFRGMSAEQLGRHVEFVTGATLFVLAHEIGHALIGVMGLAVLGREEDAADACATLLALRMGNAFADRVVANAAKGWFLSDRRDKDAGIKTVFYDEHGLDLQRAYFIVCLMVGGEPEKFSSLADDVKLPSERQGTCQGDHSNASWSWEKALKPHLRAPDQPRTKIDVTYASGNGAYDELVGLSRKLQLLEAAADFLSNEYVWPAPIRLEMQACGSPGARWDLPPKKIIVCYEIVDEFAQLYRKYGHLDVVMDPKKK
jgi:hypothetical protein